jgi:hypothetical protein
MRACSSIFPSQLSGFERVSQTPERACSGFLELPMHVSTGPLRSVPGYAFPFSEQTERIQKRARLQPVGLLFMLTPDAGDSAHISSSFLRLIIFLVGRLRRPRPSAGNANRWARPTKRAPDAGDSAAISSSFLRLSIFLAGRLRRPRPSAGNANRWAQQSVHPTLGILARFQAFFYASAFFQSDGVPPPAPARVTQTVSSKGVSGIGITNNTRDKTHSTTRHCTKMPILR